MHLNIRLYIIIYCYFSDTRKTQEGDIILTNTSPSSMPAESFPQFTTNCDTVHKAAQQSSPHKDMEPAILQDKGSPSPLQDNAILLYATSSHSMSDTLKVLPNSEHSSPHADIHSRENKSNTDQVPSMCNNYPNREKHKSLAKVLQTKHYREDALHEPCSTDIVITANDTSLHEKHPNSKKKYWKKQKYFTSGRRHDKYRDDPGRKSYSTSLQSHKFEYNMSLNKKEQKGTS